MQKQTAKDQTVCLSQDAVMRLQFSLLEEINSVKATNSDLANLLDDF